MRRNHNRVHNMPCPFLHPFFPLILPIKVFVKELKATIKPTSYEVNHKSLILNKKVYVN